VEVGSNTSTVALRVVGGDEKGTQCLGVQLGHSVPGGYNTGTWSPVWGSIESETAKYDHQSRVTRTGRLRWRGPAQIVNAGQPSRQRRCYVRTMNTRFRLKEKIAGRESQRVWRQDELIGRRRSVVK
jgi:hypothetical protein